MTRDKLLNKLRETCQSGDTERDHGLADDLLLQFINDPAITEFYDNSNFWYS